MSLFHSLYTGAAGMMAQTQSTAMISNNIANVNTVGYKKSDAVFADVVTALNNRNAYASGGVSPTRLQRVDKQGNVQQTNIATDTAIVGNGFFAVKTQPDPDLGFYYTRNGTFSEDADGILRNSSGFALYAWPLDEDGNLPAGFATYASLAPADIGVFDDMFQTTSTISQTIYLDANQQGVNLHKLGAGAEVSDQPAQFVRTVTVIDSTGQPREVTMEFRRFVGPTAHFSTSADQPFTGTTSLLDPSVFNSITAGDTFTIDTTAGGPQSYIIGANGGPGDVRIDTVGDLLSHLNNSYGGGDAVYATIDPNGQLLVRAAELGDTISLVGAVLNGAGTLNLLPQPGNPLLNYSADPFVDPTTDDINNPNQSDFPAFADPLTPNVFNWWQMRVMLPADPAQTQFLPSPPNPANTPNPAYGQLRELSKGFVNFNNDGSLNAVLDANGQAIVTLNALDFDTTDGTDDIASIDLDIAGLAQYANSYTVIESVQNGIEAGSRVGVEISGGVISAVFSNGLKRGLYQIPLVTFMNANALQDITGTVFSETEESGAGTLNIAGTGGSGLVYSSHIEGSNVDIADEFAKLIVSQRAYGASSQIIKTVDEMTQRAGELNR